MLANRYAVPQMGCFCCKQQLGGKAAVRINSGSRSVVLGPLTERKTDFIAERGVFSFLFVLFFSLDAEGYIR